MKEPTALCVLGRARDWPVIGREAFIPAAADIWQESCRTSL